MVSTISVSVKFSKTLMGLIDEKAIQTGLYTSMEEFVVMSVRELHHRLCTEMDSMLVNYLADKALGKQIGVEEEPKDFYDFLKNMSYMAIGTEGELKLLSNGAKEKVAVAIPQALYDDLDNLVEILGDVHVVDELILKAVYESLVKCDRSAMFLGMGKGIDDETFKEKYTDAFPGKLEDAIATKKSFDEMF
ncbi:MAG: hypothetical protein MJZ68_07740 [archaeon]|nr:hypothetical protein [archaeon]